MSDPTPWTLPMPEDQFEFMRQVLAAPSPVGLEAAMTFGVLEPWFTTFMPSSWAFRRFRGNASLVVDTHPGRGDLLTVMIVGHADKIRMQVRSIGDDGKIWINSDSFLPMTLIGHEVSIFPRDPQNPKEFKKIQGGTVEALGAIHFSSAAHRSGDKGITPEMLYIELQTWGDDRKKQIEDLGIRPGDPVILNRPIKRGHSADTFYGAYLDNGLGCFAAAEVARLIAERGGLEHIRCLFAFASHEEIGRMGSRVLAAELRPDVLIAVDVSHDFNAAPGVKDRRFQPLAMGAGFSLASGSIISASLNGLIEQAARDHGIPCQPNVSGRDTGTDAMGGVFGAIDAAATSLGFPIRNMHTISETGHTGDVLACIHALKLTLEAMDEQDLKPDWFAENHPRLDGL